jgi:hypothetical protein
LSSLEVIARVFNSGINLYLAFPLFNLETVVHELCFNRGATLFFPFIKPSPKFLPNEIGMIEFNPDLKHDGESRILKQFEMEFRERTCGGLKYHIAVGELG